MKTLRNSQAQTLMALKRKTRWWAEWLQIKPFAVQCGREQWGWKEKGHVSTEVDTFNEAGLIVIQLLKKFQDFMKPKCSYRVHYILGQFNLVDTLASYLFQTNFNIILNRRLSLLNCHFPLGIPTKILYPILISLCMLHVLSNLLSSICSP